MSLSRLTGSELQEAATCVFSAYATTCELFAVTKSLKFTNTVILTIRIIKQT